MKKKKGMKRIFSVIMTVLLVTAMLPAMALGADSSLSSDIVILFSGDVHGHADENLGYAALAAYKNEKMISNKYVAVVDAGDAVSGTLLASVSKGSYIVEAMNLVGYTAAVPGVHEFDFGVGHLISNLAAAADYPYISSNFFDTAANATVFSPYKLVSYGDKKVAFLGISNPQTISQSSVSFSGSGGDPAYNFCDGNNGQDLYESVQNAIDQAKAEGANYIIAIGHLDSDSSSLTASPYSPAAVIKNTSGINAFIQGGSHNVVVGEKVTDRSGNTVLISSAGTGLANIGQLVISENQTITASMISSYSLRDISTKDGIEALKTSYNAELSSAFAAATSRLEATDISGNRVIDKKETNLGDLCADAFRLVTGADIALVESQDIRSGLSIGDITYKDVMKVFPDGKPVSVVEISGADLMDALEMSARLYPNQNGGFLQVSGLTYDIQETVIPSVSLDGLGRFNGISGEYRVTNIMVGGKELDLFATYTVAGTEQLLSGNTGYTMFTNGRVKASAVTTDNLSLITYLSTNLQGTVGSLYAKSQGRVDSIKLARQSELDQEVAEMVKDQVNDYESELAQLRKQLEQTEQALAVKSATITASSKYGKSSGKRYIQITWKVSETVPGMKYQVWKSTKSGSGYKKMITTSKLTYKNTAGLVKGKTYYYKVRGYKSIGGKTYYTSYSNIAYRKVTS